MVAFANTFLSYVVVTLVFAGVMVASVFAGIFLRKFIIIMNADKMTTAKPKKVISVVAVVFAESNNVDNLPPQ